MEIKFKILQDKIRIAIENSVKKVIIVCPHCNQTSTMRQIDRYQVLSIILKELKGKIK